MAKGRTKTFRKTATGKAVSPSWMERRKELGLLAAKGTFYELV